MIDNLFMKIFFSAVVMSLLVFITSCSKNSTNATEASKKQVLKTGHIVAKISTNELSGTLGRALSEGGVSHAIEFCNVEAMPLTLQLSEKFGVDIKRATHKPRNPANLADVEELRIIKKWQSQLATEEDIKPVVNKRKQHYEVYAPIRIGNTLCLQCHGERGSDITPKNVELLSSLYQGDRATGFKMGDIRGMWSIQMPVDSAKIAAILKTVEQEKNINNNRNR